MPLCRCPSCRRLPTRRCLSGLCGSQPCWKAPRLLLQSSAGCWPTCQRCSWQVLPCSWQATPCSATPTGCWRGWAARPRGGAPPTRSPEVRAVRWQDGLGETICCLPDARLATSKSVRGAPSWSRQLSMQRQLAALHPTVPYVQAAPLSWCPAPTTLGRWSSTAAWRWRWRGSASPLGSCCSGW